MVIIALAVSLATTGQNLGTYGEVFEIEEEDCLDMIHRKLRENKHKGVDISEAPELVTKLAKRLKPVEGITETEEARKFKYDPSIVLNRDLKNTKGIVFARKGERINPLDKVSLSKPIVFIDGTKEKHIKYAASQLRMNVLTKVVLIRGSPFQAGHEIKMLIPEIFQSEVTFFDQHGLLTKKLGVKHVPAIVYQVPNEKVLTIKEEKCE